MQHWMAQALWDDLNVKSAHSTVKSLLPVATIVLPANQESLAEKPEAIQM